MSQEAVIDFLSQADTYGSDIEHVECHETHGAIVFLAGVRAYKLKRAVSYPYMDYSTPDKRHQMCQAELMVNRRTAPTLYLEVRSIVRGANGDLHFGGSEENPDALDWVVVMRRFRQEYLLEQMRKEGRITHHLMLVLADTIAAFHADAETNRNFGGAEGIKRTIDENAVLLQSMIGRPFHSTKVEQLSSHARIALARIADTLDLRRRNGYVRRCHGDLHLNNICMLNGRPVPFDAIEFNDEFAYIDVLYDLAFLIMDLDRHGLRLHANILLNRYLETAQDYDGVAALPLFLSCRAAVRAHVTVTLTEKSNSEDAVPLVNEAEMLLDRSIQYLERQPARLVAIGGVSGTGKSTLSRVLAPLLGSSPGAIILRSDVIRKRLMSADELEPLSESAYRPHVSACVYSRIAALAAKILATGHAVIADAVYANTQEREQIESVAQTGGFRFDGLWLDAPTAVLEHRIAQRHGDASDSTIQVLHDQLQKIAVPPNWTWIEAAGTPSQCLAAACGLLRLPIAEDF